MLYRVRDLASLRIAATDGDIGHVDDVYFDDATWTVRYLVVDTRHWLPGRSVLVSPHSLRGVDRERQEVRAALTRAQVEASPPVDTERPMSRQHEQDLLAYYGFPYYWTGPYRWGSAPYPAPLDVSGAPAPVPREAPPASAEQRGDPHLRSARAVRGYRIHARDDEIGHLDDLLVDDDAWAVRYVVVDTRNWWPGKHVLVSPEWIHEVSWPAEEVFVDLHAGAIRSAPAWDPSVPVDRAWEARLWQHYHRPTYWERDAA